MKTYFFILAFICLSMCNTVAQNVQIKFNKTFTNDTINLLAQVVRPVSDGYLVWGGYASTNVSEGRYLMKFDIVGNFVWIKTLLAGESWNTIVDGKFVTTTYDNNYVLAIGGIVDNAAKEIHLIKMGKEGNEIWHKSYPNDTIKFVYSIIETSDNGFALAGAMGANIVADTVHSLLIKTDSLGNMLWQKTYSMGNDARAFSVQQTPWDGGYIIGAWGYTPATGYDMFVVKTDSIGDTLWTRRYGGQYWDCGATIVPLTTLAEYNAGSPVEYLLSGCWYPSSDPVDDNVYLAKLDSVGNVVWQRTHDNLYYRLGAVQTPLIIRQGKRLIGCSYYFSGGFIRSVILAFKADGTIEWSKPITLNPTKDCYIKDMRPTEDGGYVLAGYQYDTPQTAWVMKVDSLGNTCSFVGCDSTIYTGYPIGLDEVLFDKVAFSLIPNPAQDVVNIVLPYYNQEQLYVNIYDISGRLVQTNVIKGTTTAISTEHLLAGVYLCKLSNNGSQTQKLVIIK